MSVSDRMQCEADGCHPLTVRSGCDRTRDVRPGLRWKRDVP